MSVSLTYRIECHFVEFGGLLVVSHGEVNVTNVDLEFPVVYVYAAVNDHVVCLQRFAVHLIRLILQNTIQPASIRLL